MAMQSSFNDVLTATALTEVVARVKVRLKSGRVARIWKVQWHIFNLFHNQDLDRFYMMLSKKTDRVAQVWGTETLLKREWENTDYIAKHVIQARVLSAVGFENQYPILEMTFPVPIEVTSDLTLIGVTKGTGSLIGVGCTVYYDQVEVGNVRLLKTLN